MIGLLGAELRAEWRSWAGLVLVAAVAGLAIGVGLSMMETGIHAGGRSAEGFMGAASMVLIFSGASAIAVTAAVARLAVDLGRAAHARWQLNGVDPRQVSLIVLAQIGVFSAVGAGLGLLLTTVLAEPLIHQAFESGSGGYREAPVVVGPLTAGAGVGAVVLLALLGGIAAARRAGRTPALEALRESEPRGIRLRWWRWLWFALVVAGAAAAVEAWMRAARTATAADRGSLISQTPLIAPLLTIVIVAGGPVLYPLVLRVWTALLPPRTSSAWFLARHQARYHLARTTAAITPLFTGTAMLGGFYTVTTIWGEGARTAGERFQGPQLAQMILLLGGPVLLAAVGAAVVVFMSNRVQGHEQALLSASGASVGVILRAAVWQAVIYVLTAALLAFIVIASTAAVTTVMLAPFYPGLSPRLDLLAAGILLAAGLVLTIVAVTAPTAARARIPVARALSAD